MSSAWPARTWSPDTSRAELNSEPNRPIAVRRAAPFNRAWTDDFRFYPSFFDFPVPDRNPPPASTASHPVSIFACSRFMDEPAPSSPPAIAADITYGIRFCDHPLPQSSAFHCLIPGFAPTGDHRVRRRSPLPPPIVFTRGRAPRAIISDAGVSI